MSQQGQGPQARSSSSSLKNPLAIVKGTKLEDFKYFFNDNGRLVEIENEEQGFTFDVFNGKKNSNQRRYERLGELINEEVYRRLETECSLSRWYIPEGSNSQTGTFVFVSNDWKTCDKLMILIHGSGAVRAGQWARRLIINDSLESGTQIPYIRRAVSQGYGIIVTNTNDNIRSGSKIPGSGSPREHGSSVWELLVRKSSARYIAIVAHSYGGVVTTHLLGKYFEEFRNRVFAIALTDSVHKTHHSTPPVKKFFKEVTRNWVTSSQPVSACVRVSDCQCVSAGTMKHEETSHYAITDIFDYFASVYDRLQKNGAQHERSKRRMDEVDEQTSKRLRQMLTDKYWDESESDDDEDDKDESDSDESLYS